MATAYAWVSHAPEVEDAEDIAVHSAEVNALRHAVERGWKVTKVAYGSTLHEAIAAAAAPVSAPAKAKALAREVRPEPGAVVGGKKREL